jgi:hypothetical protein
LPKDEIKRRFIMLELDPFWWKVFIVVLLMAGQAVLWAWVGVMAQKRLPWWPVRDEYTVIAEGREKQR